MSEQMSALTETIEEAETPVEYSAEPLERLWRETDQIVIARIPLNPPRPPTAREQTTARVSYSKD
jgi:hypothetical protein